MNEELPLDQSLQMLLSEQILLTRQFLSCDEKIAFLSRILSIFEADDGQMSKNFRDAYGNQENRSCLVQFLKSSLTEDQNMFVVYTARKVLTCLIKVYGSEDGLKLLQDILISKNSLFLLCTGLQICQELFSKKNSSHEWMVSQLGSWLITGWEVLLTRSEHNAAYSNCLMEYFSVFIKLVKVVWFKKEPGESLLTLQKILQSGEEFVNVLFQDAEKLYVKRKLLRFLCFVMKPWDLTNDNPLYKEIYGISASIFNRLCSSDMLKILNKSGETTFIGTSETDCDIQDATTSCDTIHVREWTFLCLCATAVLVEQQEYNEKAVGFVLKLEGYVKELLGKQTCVPFTWLPDIYGDQDDMWIDVMLLLMDIFPTGSDCLGSCFTTETRDQHHLNFLLFVGTLGYDHLVVVDLLTSPETNFLRYLLKYLKHLYKTWKEFTVLTSTWGHFNQITVNESSDGKSDRQILDQVPYSAVNVNAHDIETNSALVHSEVATNSVMKKNSDCNSGSQHSSSVLAYSSLSMIADAYDDNDDDDDDDDTDMEKVVLSTVVGKPLKIQEECMLNEQEMIETCKGNMHTDENELNGNKFDSVAVPTFNKSMNNLQEGSNLFGSIVSQDFCQSLDDDNASDSVLDKVMGLLIRTRMKLEKLSESDLIKYNPSVLVNLIASVEELYEDN